MPEMKVSDVAMYTIFGHLYSYLIDVDLLEEVRFEFSTDQLTQLKNCLPRISKRAPGSRTQMHNGTDLPLRRGSRRRKKTAKAVSQPKPKLPVKQNSNGKEGDKGSGDAERQPSPSEETSAALSSEAQGLEDDSEQYIRIDYTFHIEVEGLLLIYFLECPIGDEIHTVRGEVSLAPIFDPGTA